MAVCLEYQSIYAPRREVAVSVRMQVLAGSCLLIALLAKVWVKIEATEVGYQLAKEQRQTVELDMQRRELELQKSILLRPDQLRAAASARLGLQPLNPQRARRMGTVSTSLS